MPRIRKIWLWFIDTNRLVRYRWRTWRRLKISFIITISFLKSMNFCYRKTCAELEPSAGVRSKFRYIRRFDSIEFSSRLGSSLRIILTNIYSSIGPILQSIIRFLYYVLILTWYGWDVLAAIDDGVILIGTGWNISVLFDIVVANFGRVEAEDTLKMN